MHRARTLQDSSEALIVLDSPLTANIDLAAAKLQLHPLILEDLHSGRQYPKYERLGRHMHFSLWDADTTPAPRSKMASSLSIIFDDRDLLVVQRDSGGQKRDMSKVLDSERSAPPVARVYWLLDAIVNDFVAVGAGIEQELDELEQEVFAGRMRESSARIYALRRQIGHTDRALTGFAEALSAARADLDIATALDPELRVHFEHLETTIDGVAQLARDAHGALDAVLTSHENNVARRQNQDMRTISAFAALLAIPTVISGIYGMNFPNLPPLEAAYGWIVVVSVMVVVDAAAFFTFRRKGWLGGRRQAKHDSGET